MASYLDLETTGLSLNDKIVEIGVVGEDGNVLFHSIINPERRIPDRIRKLLGVLHQDFETAPRLEDVLESLRSILSLNGPVVIFNASYDKRFFPAEFWEGIEVSCARTAFRRAARGDATLEVAASRAGYNWDDLPHRAVSDARACRAVWNWAIAGGNVMESTLHNHSPSELAALAWDAYKRAREAEEELEKYKSALIEVARGGKLTLEVPQICRVSVSATPKVSMKKSYLLVNETFDCLQHDLRELLIERGVVKEKKISDEPRRPTVRFAPV